MTTTTWRTVFGIAAAVVAYLLIQTDVTLLPIVKVALGATAVGLAVIQAPRTETQPPA